MECITLIQKHYYYPASIILYFVRERGLEDIHRKHENRRSRRKGKPVSGGKTGPSCDWGT
jgi:hypothetical protein